MVLDTDLASHFSSLAKFNSKVSNSEHAIAAAAAGGTVPGTVLEAMMVDSETRLMVRHFGIPVVPNIYPLNVRCTTRTGNVYVYQKFGHLACGKALGAA
jgi:hypothetical protein